jgi:hypothetical protein
MNIYLLNTKIDQKETLLLSIINPELDSSAKLTSKAIIGFIIDSNKPIDETNVRINPQFLDHFHKTILFYAQFNDGIIHLVEKEQNGFIYIRDKRNKTEENATDIIGSFEVKNGALVHDSYIPNPLYKLITANGGFELEPALEALLYNTSY